MTEFERPPTKCHYKECQKITKDVWCCTEHFSLSMIDEQNTMVAEIQESLESEFPNLDFPIRVSCTKTTKRVDGDYRQHIWIVVNGTKIRWQLSANSMNCGKELSTYEVRSKAYTIIRKLIKQKQDDEKEREYENQRNLKAEQEYKEANAKDTIELDKISKYIKSERSHDGYTPRGRVQRTHYTVVRGNMTIHLEKEHGGNYGIDRINRPIHITGIEITDLSVGDSVKKILEESK